MREKIQIWALSEFQFLVIGKVFREGYEGIKVEKL